MSDRETIDYVRRMIVSTLNDNSRFRDGVTLMLDTSNTLLLAHIKDMIKLLEKARDILENKES